MEPMRHEILVDYPRSSTAPLTSESENGQVFDSAIGIVVGLALGLLSWGLIAALWVMLT